VVDASLLSCFVVRDDLHTFLRLQLLRSYEMCFYDVREIKIWDDLRGVCRTFRVRAYVKATMLWIFR